MIPTLQKVILNGASRHRLSKGFILVSDNRRPVEVGERDRIIQMANQGLAVQASLSGFAVEPRPTHVSLIGLASPFLPVYDVAHRDVFITKLATSVNIVKYVTERAGYRLIAAGVNPIVADGDSQVPALCADLHQVEMFDDGEIERVYNLYRQFLPELLAISTHAAVYGGVLQKDFSLRMRVNPASFLPRYLSQFSARHLDKLRSMMRKDYGLADLQQMDINPLAGDSDKLSQDNPPMLLPTPAAAELRFVDAQCAYPYIRGQLILFQAIAMYGRNLARQGKRLPYMRDEVIDENKALAVQNGPGAILKPDAKFKKDDGGAGFSFHDKGIPERATTSLLMIMDGLLLPYLRELECHYWELAPIVLGAELRRRGRQCFANYAEYQKYLYYTYSGRFAAAFHEQVEQLLTSPRMDFVTEYNQRTYGNLAAEIEEEWQARLTPRPRHKGQVKWYNPKKGYGFIRTEQGEEIHVQREDIEGVDRLEDGQPVTLEILMRRGRQSAVRVRLEAPARSEGQVVRFDEAKGFGFIAIEGQDDVYVHHSDVVSNQDLMAGDRVSFEIVQQEKGPRAVRVEVQERLSQQGQVVRFDEAKGFGFIAVEGQDDIYVHRSEVVGGQGLMVGDRVSFEIVQQEKGPRAIRVEVQERSRQLGHVKWFNPKKRFGYITSDDGNDIFVHQGDLQGAKTLKQNQKVSFEIGQSPKGPKAIRVLIIEE